MAHLALALLGPMQVLLDGTAAATFEYNKVRALLAYLVVEADRPHRREHLIGQHWLVCLRSRFRVLYRTILNPSDATVYDASSICSSQRDKARRVSVISK
jgi:DNA-binding SARP family transcriptional activator